MESSGAKRRIRADPGNALAHASTGFARLCLGDDEGAATDFRRALEIDPGLTEIRRALAHLRE